jgi:hypothetical protein
MYRRMVSCTVSVVIVASSLAVAWSHWGTKQAGGLVEEANRHYRVGATLHNDARPKFNTLIKAVRSVSTNRVDLEAQARELGEIYTHVAAEYRLAAAKIDQAAKRSPDADVAAYFDAKSRLWTKSAEVREILRDYVRLIIDQNVGVDEFQTRQAALDTQIKLLDKQETELTAAADKLFNRHRPKFD